ncbi:MAG: Glucans biosynthesis protein C [Candidatus Erwinia impunctatus]|nr:Glucans biosynthesis protein C [Culicoides impunctatus]
MSNPSLQREYFLDSIRAYLMLLGIPFHLSLIYSTQTWTVNSTDPSLWLTLLNDFIHSFRMQVFFVISGYFSYMLYLRYQTRRWIAVRMTRVGIPMLSANPLLTLPQFFLIKEWTTKVGNWETFSFYQKFNALCWDLISHLWFLLVLLILTLSGLVLFKFLRQQQKIKTDLSDLNWQHLTMIFLGCGILWGGVRRIILSVAPALLGNALFNYIVMQSLFYLPFFILGALAWQYPAIKALFVRPQPGPFIGAIAAYLAYIANLAWNKGNGWLYEIDTVISMLMGLWMVNIVFSLGYRLLNSHSPRVSYLVNASLFIYLVHHPLTLLFGIFIMPLIHNDTIGFFSGLILIFGCSFVLYEIHLRIPLLRFLFSGKKQEKHG